MEKLSIKQSLGIIRMTLLTIIFGKSNSHIIFHISLFDSDSIDLYRYTYRPDTKAVYGTLTQAYQSSIVLGNVKLGSGSKVSLVGYTGEVTWKAGANNSVEISMPSLPLDTDLKWAWVFKFENVL